MNRTKQILLIATFAINFCHAEDFKITNYYYGGAHDLGKAFVADTTNVKGEKNEDMALLKSSFTPRKMQHGNWITVQDSLVLGTPGQKQVHQLYTLLQADNYTEGVIKAKAPAVSMLMIDGKEVSINSKGTPLALDPGKHEIYLTCMTNGTAPAISISYEAKKNNLLHNDRSGMHINSVEDMIHGKRVTSGNLSPDGNYIIVMFKDVKQGGKTETSYELRETVGNRLVYKTTTPIKWSGNQHTLLYSKAAAAGKEIHLLNPITYTDSLLAVLPENMTEYELAPTHDFLILSSNEEGPKEGKLTQQILEPDDRIPGWRTRTNLYKLDLKSGYMKQLTFGHSNLYLCSISDDGKKLLFVRSEYDIQKFPFDFLSLYLMDLEREQTETLIQHSPFLSSAELSPDGKQILLSGGPESLDNIGLNVEEGQTANLFDTQLYLYDLASKKYTALTRDFNPSVTSFAWSRFDNQIYLNAEDKDCNHLYVLNPKDGKIRQIPSKVDVVSHFSIAEQNGMMAYTGQSISTPAELYLLNLRKQTQKKLAGSIEEDYPKRILGDTHEWDYVNSRGDTISGRYYLPPHFDAHKKYPMIVYYYGGCSPTPRTYENTYAGHLFAAHGYVVYVVQPSGTTGFGQKFSARHVAAWGDYTADDIIEGTKKFCAAHSFVNAQKVGCCGASYGGFMTQTLQTKTDIFAAAISHAGISNITSYWGEGYWGYSYSACASAQHYPWNDPELYTKHSPLFNADKIKTPLLFLHGTADTNVPIGESIQMYNALKILGKETAFVQVPGENHHILTYDKRIQWQKTIFAWFAKWLQEDDSWWNALYPKKNL